MYYAYFKFGLKFSVYKEIKDIIKENFCGHFITADQWFPKWSHIDP